MTDAQARNWKAFPVTLLIASVATNIAAYYHAIEVPTWALFLGLAASLTQLVIIAAIARSRDPNRRQRLSFEFTSIALFAITTVMLLRVATGGGDLVGHSWPMLLGMYVVTSAVAASVVFGITRLITAAIFDRHEE